MSNPTVVRTALAAQITANCLPALPAWAEPLDQVNPPAALVLPSRGTYVKYGVTLGGPVLGQGGLPLAATELSLDVVVLVAKSSTIERVQQALDQWLGLEYDEGIVSVPMAISLDPTLGGACAWCEPDRCTGPAPVEYNSAPYFGARITCSVSMQ